MCWPDADPHWKNYNTARTEFIRFLNRYPGYKLSSEDTKYGIVFRFAPNTGGDISVVRVTSYFKEEEIHDPVIVCTEDEVLREAVEGQSCVKLMRESMTAIRTAIKEDRVMIRLKHGVIE